MYFRATEHKATGETPNAMVFGRELTQPIDLQFRFLDEETKSQAPNYVIDLQERLIKTHQVMEQRLSSEAKVAKRYYDAKSRHGSYKRGDFVLLYDPTKKKGLRNKMRALWHGTICGNQSTFQRYISNRKIVKNKSKWKVVHFDKLRPYFPREPADIGWLENISDDLVGVEPPDSIDLSIEIADDMPAVSESGIKESNYIPVDENVTGTAAEPIADNSLGQDSSFSSSYSSACTFSLGKSQQLFFAGVNYRP